MIKTIFVPISGCQSEDSVFETALAAARPLRGHIEFYRVRYSALTVVAQDPHVGFRMGGATTEMLQGLAAEERDFSAEASRHFHRFCRRHNIVEASSPADGRLADVSAQLTHEAELSSASLLSRGRRSDLIVLGRPVADGHLRGNLIELLLIGLVESLDTSATAIAQVRNQLDWHGICADIRPVVCARTRLR